MRICEIYTSIQGEGPNTGVPITFVRFGGCNLRCPGWGTGTLPDGTEVPGCDTVFAVYPQWSDTWDKDSPSGIKAQIPSKPKRVCLTGGEPLIQRSKELNQLAYALIEDDYKIDLFTNGSVLIADYLWTSFDAVTVIMDWKLPGSGEGDSFDVNNLAHLGSKDAIKFVCKDTHDFEIALAHIEWAEGKRLSGGPDSPQVWFSPVWNEMDPGVLALLVQANYLEGHLNVQTHKYIHPPDMRRV